MSNHFYFHWLYYTRKKRHHINLAIALFFWLFLLITQPFGIINNNLNSIVGLAFFLLVFGVLWLLASYATDFIFQKLYPGQKPASETADRWLWLIKLALFVHFIFLIRQLLCDFCLAIGEYFEIWLAVAVILGLSYVIISLYARYQYYQSMVGIGKDNKSEFILKGDGESDLRVDLNDLAYIKADDNYVDLFFSDHQELLRATLKSIESQLSHDPRFIRVHRSYIINVAATDQIEKDRVLVRSKDNVIEIPVSKTYQDRLVTFIS